MTDGWFRTLIDTATDVYFRYDLLPARRFADVSPAIAAATGYVPEDFYRDPGFCIRVVVRDDRRLLRQIVRARRGLALALSLKTRDGSGRPFEIRTAPLVRRGRLVAVEGIARPMDRGHPGAEHAAEPVQQRLIALLYEVHELLHRAPPPLAGVPPSAPATELRAGGISLDPERLAVTLAGTPVALTSRELMVLRYLFQHAGRVVTRAQLLTDVWGYRYTGDHRTVDVHVSRLRRKLPPLTTRLVAVKHLGYRLDADPADPASRRIANF